MFWEEMGPIPHLILFRAVEKPFFIYSHLSCYLLEIIVSCYVLVLGEEEKKDKKYLTIKFISVFFFFNKKITSVGVAGHQYDKKYLLIPKPKKVHKS